MRRDPIILCILAAQPPTWVWLYGLIFGPEKPVLMYGSLVWMAVSYLSAIFFAIYKFKNGR